MSVLKKCYFYDLGAPVQYKYTSIINPLSAEPKWGDRDGPRLTYDEETD